MKALDNRHDAESIVLLQVLCCFRDTESAAVEDQSLKTKIDKMNEIKRLYWLSQGFLSAKLLIWNIIFLF